MVGGEIDAPGGRITVCHMGEDGELHINHGYPKKAASVVEIWKRINKTRVMNE